MPRYLPGKQKVVKIETDPLRWLCKLNGKKEPQAIRQKKHSAKRSKAVCAGHSRVLRGSLTAAVAGCESCLCDSCNSAYAWQWFVIHLWFESSLDFNAFLSISNAYLMPHATPHESKAKEQTKQTGSANVQRGVCAMSADAIESSGHFGCYACACGSTSASAGMSASWPFHCWPCWSPGQDKLQSFAGSWRFHIVTVSCFNFIPRSLLSIIAVVLLALATLLSLWLALSLLVIITAITVKVAKVIKQ